MRVYLTIILTFLVLYCFPWCSAQNVDQMQGNDLILHNDSNNKTTLIQIAGRKLNDLWTWIKSKSLQQDTVIGRCFGIARKIKMLMPIVIFKMGVIMTTLLFLTIFSLKGLGLLVTLLVLNVGGLFSKLALFKHQKQETGPITPPQNVHFHIHPDKLADYAVGHSAPGPHSYHKEVDWDRNVLDNNYNLYNNNIKNNNLMHRLALLRYYNSLYNLGPTSNSVSTGGGGSSSSSEFDSRYSNLL